MLQSPFPGGYHAMRAALIHYPHAPMTRRVVAMWLRACRKHYGREDARMEAYAASFIGWPVRRRPNGRYS